MYKGFFTNNGLFFVLFQVHIDKGKGRWEAYGGAHFPEGGF